MIKCIKFRAYEKNTLRAFVDLELTRVGIVIHDCTWHLSHGKEWVSFPARSYQDKNGAMQWSPVVEFSKTAGETREVFQTHAVAAIHEAAEKEPTP